MVYRSSKKAEEQKEIKKKLILDTSAQLFVKNGYHNTSVKDIVELAGISVGSFYFYFTSKEDLYETLYDEMNETFLNVLEEAYSYAEKDVIYCLSNAIVNTLFLFQGNQELSKILLNSSISIGPTFENKRINNNKRFYKIVEDIIRILKEKSFVKCENIEIASMSIMGGIIFLITNLLEENYKKEMIPIYSYSIIAYNLRALDVSFDEKELESKINNIIKESEYT